LYRAPVAIIAQAIRASLLASAMAATLVGRRVSNAVSQGRCLVPWISSSSASSSMFRLHVLSGKPKSAPVSDALGQCPCVNLSKYVVERYLGLFMQPWWPPLLHK